jgi:ubiquinone/menaquinone biosynthesis C-methylase UbiE
MKRTPAHSGKFQKNFYDKLAEERGKEGRIFSCSAEERYNSRLVVNDEKAVKLFKNLFSRSLGEGKSGTVLDLCTGSGIHLPVLSQCAQTVVGADISIGLLKRAQEIRKELELDNTFLFQVRAEAIPLRDSACDAIIMIDALHHVENQQMVMEELRRVGKDGAPLLLIEPNISNPLVFIAHLVPKEERGALRLNTARGLSRLLRSYLDNVNVEPFNYVASRKTNVFLHTILQVVKWFCETIFFFWPIRLVIRGSLRKQKRT